MRTARSSILLASVSVLAFSSILHAQTPGDTGLEEVTVTGSRVIKNGNDSPTPVTVVSTEDLLTVHPSTVIDGLNDLPVFSGSRGQLSNPGNGYSTQPSGANNSASVMNLRNLGFARTLVLFDGLRVPPTSPDGLVDANMIPEMLLQRVDVVTGGASAVYGSDAVGGVVNFITDTHFNGLKLEAQTGVSTYGDDPSYKTGLAVGTKLFGGRGHFEGSIQYYDDYGILSRRSRDLGKDDWTVQGGGTAANPYHLVENTRISTTSFGGLINSGPLAGQQFAANGVLSPFVNGAATGTNGYQSGGDGGYYDGSLKAPLQRTQLFGRFDYDVTDDIRSYIKFSGSQNQNKDVYSQQFFNNLTIGSQNAFLAPQYQSALAAAGASSFKLSKILEDAPAITPQTLETQWFMTAGIDGALGDYGWNANYTHGETRQQTRINNNVNDARLYAALDATTNPATGQTVCNVTLTNPGLYPGCTPLNLFGPTSESAAALGYILQTTEFTAHTAMDDLTGSFTGAPFETWAGPVNMALSGEWRRLGYDAESDAVPTSTVNCTGLRYNCTATSLAWGQGTFANRSPVSQTVREGAIEMDAPLLKGLPFADKLDFTGAFRYTDYDTSGLARTWKLGLDWHVNNELTFRATRSRDIRAPTLNDLYASTSIGQGTFTDLLTGKSYQAITVSSGNPALRPEEADTKTAGFVWQPDILPKFSFSVDAFDIDIHNAITNLQGTNPSVQSVCYASGGTSPYCALQVRPLGFANTSAANQVTQWNYTEINVATQQTWGADFEANYAATLFDNPFSLRGLLTYQPHIIYKTPGLNTVDLGGVAFSSNALQASPKLRLSVFGRYSVGDLTVDVVERWRSSLSWTGDSTQIVSQSKIPSIAYTDVNVSYRLEHLYAKPEIFLNAQNLFNAQPPPAAFIGANGAVGILGGFASGDDPIGRYISMGIRFKV